MQEQQNIRTLQLMLRVIADVTGEIPTIIPDGIYGPRTAESVRAFQAAAGLPVTGKTDEATWRSISTAYARLVHQSIEAEPLQITLQRDACIGRGSRNLHVFLIEAMLHALHCTYRNLPAVSIDGQFDRQCEESVRCFQRCAGLPETGQVCRKTWEALTACYRLAAGTGEDSSSKNIRAK